MTKLRIGLFQMNIAWENPSANRLKIENLITQHSGKLDLLVLPEMFLTGFSCVKVNTSHFEYLEQTSWLKNLSEKHSIALMGSLRIEDEQKMLKNRMVLVDGKNILQTYDKRHLFVLSAEAKNFSRGTDTKIFQLNGWSIFPQVCYDLRFPVWARNTQNYDLLINVANWPATRRHAWRSLLIARAIENQCYVIGVNRYGSDENALQYSGDSLVISPLGEILHDCGSEENFATVEIDKSEVTKIRTQFPFLKDRDSFTLNSETSSL